jgi:hypothetical protein
MQSNEILLNLSMKLSIQCTRFESNYSSCTGRSSENVCSRAVEAIQKTKDRMKLSLPPKLTEKLVWVPVILLCIILIPYTCLMLYYYAKTSRSHPLIARLYR